MTQADPPTDLIEATTRLLRERDLGPFTQMEPLSGGRNNRTYRVTGSGGSWALKHYFQGESASRDRRGSEWDWSTFCWQQGVKCIPEPIATAVSAHASLFEFVQGRQLQPDEVTESHVQQAADFVVLVNRHVNHPAARNLPHAAEACFSLAEHVDCVDRRVERLSNLPIVDAVDGELKEWLRDSLIPVWQLIIRSWQKSLNPQQIHEPLPLAARCLSPSDFGFHNALLTERGSLSFLDFEYAGWDDPAKLVCDFFWQQQVPAPRNCRQLLIATLANPGIETELTNRVDHLFPVYGIKWCCLVLNEFVTEDRRRREFASSAPINRDRRQHQFQQAKRLLLQVQADLK